ncbi:unnamed protein product [Parnassius apollo]|uniref:(apollo) hypothetical protein n=1 Tax=Parnassius apollo TaxID=110799 RepID=A0A8S3XY30_PARAO|nr:unnamed protein product [Parnassius apollo]
MKKVAILNQFIESDDTLTFPKDVIQNLRRAILAPPAYKPTVQQALQNINFQFHRRSSFISLIRECNASEGQTRLIFWGNGSSDSRITIMSASSNASLYMPSESHINQIELRSTGQQTDISCQFSGFSSPVLMAEVDEQRALRERIADSLTFSSAASPPLQSAGRSVSILGSVCALLLRKQGSSGATKEACELSGSWQSASICRICFGGASRERLARPCGCRGTVAAVHRSCLERWLLQAATSHCELCRHHYLVTRTHKWSWWWCVVAWARAGAARALLADMSRGAALGCVALLGTSRALRMCDLALQAGAARGGLAALAANVFSSLLIGLIGALNGLLTTWMLLKVQEHQAGWRAWRDASLRVHVLLPDPTPTPGASAHPTPSATPTLSPTRPTSPSLMSLRTIAEMPPTVDRATNIADPLIVPLTVPPQI